jgi:hypothetical protein
VTDLRIQAEVSVEARRAGEELRRAAGQVEGLAGALDGVRTEATSAAAAVAQLAQQQANAARAAESGGDSVAAPLEEVASAAGGAVEALKAVDKSQEKAKFSAANLGQQIGDVASGLASGVPPAQIFAQQAGQLAFALSGMAGVLGRIGTFLSGPWGAAILGGTVILASLTRGHKDADAAAEAQAKAEADLKKAIEELDRSTDLSLKSQRESIRLGIEQAQTKIAQARATREATKANLEAAIAERQATQIRAGAAGPRGEVASLGLPQRDGVIEGLRQKLAQTNADIANSQALLRQVEFKRSLADIETGTNAVAVATRAYEEAQVDLQREVKAGTITQAEAFRELSALKRVIEEAEAAERKGTGTRKGASASLKENAADLRAAERAARKLAEALAPIFDEGRNRAGFGAALRGAVEDLGQSRGTPFFEADRPADRLTEITRGLEGQMIETARSAGDAFSDAVLNQAVAIGQAIGGGAGNAIRTTAGILQGARTGNFTGLGGQLGGFLTLASGVRGREGSLGGGFSSGFGRSIFGADGQSELGKALRPLKPMADAIGRAFGDGGKQLGKAAGGAATGSAISGLANAIGIKLNETGAQVGGAVGQLIGGPLGSLLGSVFGGIIGNLFAKSGSTTVRSSGGEISKSGSGNAGVQRATSGLGSTIETAIETIAQQLGAQIGDFEVSIGKRGSSFRVDSLGLGRIRGSGVTATKDEAEALQLAIADAIRDGAIVTSPRIRAALDRYADNVNKALSEALKVKQLEDLLASRGNPFAAMFRDMEFQIRQRNDVARRNGFDLVEIEKLNAEQRAETIQNALERTTGSIKSLLLDLTVGAGATGSARQRIEALTAERERVAALVRGGDVNQMDNLANIARQLDELQREAFGSAGGFAAGRSETISLLNSLVTDTEARIRAAADAARTENLRNDATLQSMDATLEDSFNVQRTISENIARISGLLAIPFGNAQFQIAQEYGR